MSKEEPALSNCKHLPVWFSRIIPICGSLFHIQLQISNERFNLNDEEVSEMASFFTNLLAEIKHRGAFEQAYLGFCNLCNFLWRRKTGESCQPPDMLKETMAALTGTGKNKFCSTRRSAGVPFLIQVRNWDITGSDALNKFTSSLGIPYLGD